MDIPTAKILVVDDDWAICNLITRFLAQKNYLIKSAYDGNSALTIFDIFDPDLVILDVNLPDYLGYYLCEEMQSRTEVFILMLTSRADVADKHEGFSKGADDYLTKPFDLQELEFRVKAILKRQKSFIPENKQPLVFDTLVIDPIRREVSVRDKPVILTSLEFNLLYFLAKCPGRVWNRKELIEYVWNYQYLGAKRVVDVHIGQIRKKIEIDAHGPIVIHTVRGVGYKFELHQ